MGGSTGGMGCLSGGGGGGGGMWVVELRGGEGRV